MKSKVSFYTLLVSLLPVALASEAALAGSRSMSVQTASGPVLGKSESGGIARFLGIPYAAPPVGKLRWRAPQEPASWSAPLEAYNDGPACVQPKTKGKPEALGSEDCLKLNVWAPRTPSAQPRPVMVFIHGGFYVGGASNEKYGGLLKAQDGAELARHGDLVVVSFDYRVGVMGFLAADALQVSTESGNYGLLDQIAALRWVKKNIRAFGGDPKQVTVFGQSAGGSSIITLMASPLAKGLFSRAIVQSGYFKSIPKNAALAKGQRLIERAGCADKVNGSAAQAECLRALPAEKVLEYSAGSALEGQGGLDVPYQDGVVISAPIEELYTQGRFAKIPLVIGTNRNETATLVPALYGGRIQTEEQLEKIIAGSYGPAVWEHAQRAYGRTQSGTPEQRLESLTTDLIFTCTAEKVAQKMAETSKAGVWRYVFSHSAPLPGAKKLGPFHGLEVPYVFGNLPGVVKLIPGESSLSAEMRDAWLAFAKSGDPSRPRWSAFSRQTPGTFEFGLGQAHLLPDFKTQECGELRL